MPRPKTHDDAMRIRLLDRAGELLSTEGPAALSLRRLAADVGTSTTAVYSLFGGKPALVRELFVEALHRFGARLTTVPDTDDPAEDLVQLGLAYRRGALADPHLYAIMFSASSPGCEPDGQAAEDTLTALSPLTRAVARGVESGRFAAGAPARLAIAAWSLVHGLVSLELSGKLPKDLDVESFFEHALRASLHGWLA